MCPVIHKEDFDRRRDEKEVWHKAIKIGQNLGDRGERLPVAITSPWEFGKEKKEPIPNWDAPPPSAPFDKEKDFPLLPNLQYKNAGAKVSDILTGGADDSNLR
jgi:hypothetical protein